MTTMRGLRLAATDPERSRAFYNALGYRGNDAVLVNGVRPEYRITIEPGSGNPPAQDFSSVGVLAVDFYTADLAAAITTLTAAGGSVWSGPTEYSYAFGPLQHAMVSGPDAERVGLIQVNRKPSLVDWSASESLFSEPCLCPIGVSGAEAALAFYRDTLGWGIASETDVGPGPIRAVMRIPPDRSIRVLLLDTGGASRPRPELLLTPLTGSTAPPQIGWIGLDDGADGQTRRDPTSGLTFHLTGPA